MGDCEFYLKEALIRLDAHPSCNIGAISPIYETAAWGKTDQPDFLNLACQVDTDMEAVDFLQYCQRIEEELHRVRLEKWGERTIDIDIIFWNRDIIFEECLLVPHLYAHERAFVLFPLRDIAPDFVHPQKHQTVSELLTYLDGTGIRLYQSRL